MENGDKIELRDIKMIITILILNMPKDFGYTVDDIIKMTKTALEKYEYDYNDEEKAKAYEKYSNLGLTDNLDNLLQTMVIYSLDEAIKDGDVIYRNDNYVTLPPTKSSKKIGGEK